MSNRKAAILGALFAILIIVIAEGIEDILFYRDRRKAWR